MPDFKLPDDFAPTFAKWYTVAGMRFNVSVQSKGMRSLGEDTFEWVFAIHTGPKGDNLVEAGLFHWKQTERFLNDENVCNHLASFYGDSKQVKDGQTAEEVSLQLDEIVLKCAAYMFEQLITELGKLDYEIIQAVMDENGWHVILQCHLMPGQMFDFQHKTGSNAVNVSTYIKAHSFFTEL